MFRTLIIASTALVALSACDERSNIERERATDEREIATKGEPYAPPNPAEKADKNVRKEGKETAEKPRQAREEMPARKPVGGIAGETEKQPTAGTTGALGHMPDGCKAVAHADVSKLVGLPGAKEHLIPAFQTAKKAETGNQGIQRLFTLLKDAGIDSTKELDAIAICVNDVPTASEAQSGKAMANTNLVIVITGELSETELVAALLKRGDKSAEKLEIGGADVFRDREGGLYIGQTDDGTIIAAPTRESFAEALSGGGDYALTGNNAFGLVLPSATMKSLLERFGDPTAKKLAGNVERTALIFDAGKNTLSLSMDMPDHTQAAELGGVLKAIQTQWKSNQPTDAAEKRLAALLKDAAIVYTNDVVSLTVPVKDDQIESVMRSLAGQVRATLY